MISYFSYSERREIIFSKLGEIGCSSLAANRIQVVTIQIIFISSNKDVSDSAKYLSKMFAATNKVSILYYFN